MDQHDSSRKPSWFACAAQWVSKQSGKGPTFGVALATVIVWALSGPIFKFSETWQLVINTGTTIVTFLMVFLIQNTQNRDTESMQLKLDELIRANKRARNAMLDLEELSEEELDELRAGFVKLAEKQREEGENVKPGPDDMPTTEHIA